MPRLRKLYSKNALFLYAALFIALLLAFLKRADSFQLALNLASIAIAVAAFEHGYAFSYSISLAFSIVIFIAVIYNPATKLPYLVSAVFLNLIPLASGYYNLIYNERRVTKESLLNKARASFDELSNELRALRDAEAALENRVGEILGLYEVTKKMGASLDMTEMLLIFREAVGKVLKFTKSDLILIDEAKRPPVAAVTYEILNSVSKAQPSQFDQILVETFLSRKEVVHLKLPVDDAHPFKPYLAEYKGAFIAIPLFSEETMIGILVILGAEEEDVEKIYIMAEQLALEIKKVSLYEKVQTLAITDGLTNIYVRRHFLERLNEEAARSKRHKLNLSLLMIDIDHFKLCNNMYGHLVGDIVLREFAKIMKENVRIIDLVGRYGGEEFVIALSDTDKASAVGVAQRIRQSVEEYRFEAYDEIINATVSIGLATYPDDGEDVAQLIDRADQALYKAKEEGRNRVCFWP